MRKLTVVVIAALALPGGIAAAKKKGEFFIHGAKLAKQADGSWSGPGTLDGVGGTVTLTGAPDPATDAVQFESKSGFRKVRWTWVAGKRRVAGCARERIIVRPHGVLLWDGGGRITKTSAQERKYKGRKIDVYGPTQSSDPSHAQLSIHQSARGTGSC